MQLADGQDDKEADGMERLLLLLLLSLSVAMGLTAAMELFA